MAGGGGNLPGPYHVCHNMRGIIEERVVALRGYLHHFQLICPGQQGAPCKWQGLYFSCSACFYCGSAVLLTGGGGILRWPKTLLLISLISRQMACVCHKLLK
jgi:hypothetical protein